ncbi:MAG: protein DA1 [Candidatus Sericytochromatia bacterium]|nr:protein DA1 [Candidatus Sericytochromatia bacterium]
MRGFPAVCAAILAIFLAGPRTGPVAPVPAAEAQVLYCAYCGRQIEGRYLQDQGRAYHPKCAAQVAPRCVICTKPILTSARVDIWGFHAHSDHGWDIDWCTYCGRIIGQASTGGGVTYTDGRAVCNLCRKTAIDTPEAGARVMARVRKRLVEWGIVLDYPPIPLQVGMKPWLRQVQGQGSRHIGETAEGLMEAEVTQRVKRGKGLGRRVVLSIYALSGMPEEKFASVMGHELMHAWGYLAGSQRRHPQLEEGAASYVEALILAEARSPEGAKRLEMIQNERDYTYGTGFRRVRRFVETRGWTALLDVLRTQEDLPPGY